MSAQNGYPQVKSLAARRSLVSLIATLACLTLLPGTALASGSITEFSAGLGGGNVPEVLAVGPDGNLWFTNPAAESSTPSIGRISPAGTITEFTTGLQTHSDPGTIIAGPDGNLWFTDSGGEGGTPSIGRITPSGTITEFHSGLNQEEEPVSLQGPNDIVAGPDGNLWFSDSSGFESANKPDIGRITPAGAITEFELPGACNEPEQIVVGPDSNLWAAEGGKGPFCGAIARVTTSGTITEFPSTWNEAVGWPKNIVSGPDGKLWFTGTHAIGRITPAGIITPFSSGLSSEPYLWNIIAGPDGNLWFTDSEHVGNSSSIDRITPSGTITEFPVDDASHNFVGSLLSGPDGDLWFTDTNRGEGGSSAIGRMTTSGQVTLFSDGLKERGEPSSLVIGPSASNLWFIDREWMSGAAAIGRIAPVEAGISPNPTLSISTQGNGSVSSEPSGISCGSTCDATFSSESVVTLTATPASGYTFAGSNANRKPCEFYCTLVADHEGERCSGTSPCNLMVRGDTRISAVFLPIESGEEEGGVNEGGKASTTASTDSTPGGGSTGSRSPQLAVFGGVGLVVNGTVKVNLRCPSAQPCRGVAALMVQGKRQHKPKRQRRHARSSRFRHSRRGGQVVIGRKHFVIPPGSAAAVAIKLSVEGKRLLKTAGSHGLEVQLVGVGVRGRALRLRPGRPGRTH